MGTLMAASIEALLAVLEERAKNQEEAIQVLFNKLDAMDHKRETAREDLTEIKVALAKTSIDTQEVLVRMAVLDDVKALLSAVGITPATAPSVQADLLWLHAQRTMCDENRQYARRAVITLLVGGIGATLGAFASRVWQKLSIFLMKLV